MLLKESTGLGVGKSGLWIYPCPHSLDVPGTVTQLLYVTLLLSLSSISQNKLRDVDTFGKQKRYMASSQHHGCNPILGNFSQGDY